MASPILIIDGYNLLHAAGLSQARYAPAELQRQRHRLLIRLAGMLTAEERLRCTVIFDAIEAPSGLSRQFRHAEMTVLFAEPGHDADSLIEELVDDHKIPSQLRVISSDNRIQKAARHRKAESLTSEEFLNQLIARSRDKPPTVAPKPARGEKLSKVDTAYWIEEFGEIDLQALARSDDPSAGASSEDPWEKNIQELQRRLEGGDLDDWLNQRPS